MSWNKVRARNRRDGGRRYAWTLERSGRDYVLLSVIGTVSQVAEFCESEKLNAVSQYNLTFDDECNPFIIHL